MKSGTSKRLLWSWAPESRREADDAIVKNLWLHWFPGTVTRRSLSFTYSFWLGTISGVLFAILAVTGIVLMFYYIPSMERAYASMKDINYAVSYGWFFRGMHRVAAQLMVITVFLHMMRVFYSRAYKRSPGYLGNRPLNWVVGVVLLVVTLALSYTGYLLPMDQLAYWAMIIGTSVAGSVPVIGEYIQLVLTGGTEIGQNALLRFYVLHCVMLPILLIVLVAYHMWRIRKDGGLACVDQTVLQKKADIDPVPTKTYSLLGVAKGNDVTVRTSSYLEEEDRIESAPNVVRRVWIVALATLAVTIFLAIYFRFPLEAPANSTMAPNPAKAPWYFLWLQELIADTTFTIVGITFNGAFLGGVLIPSTLLAWLIAVPYLDKGSTRSNGVWFPRERLRQNVLFTVVFVLILILIYIGAFCRGPDWIFYWPWQEWPVAPVKF